MTMISEMTRDELKAAIPAHDGWKEYRDAAGITKRIGEMTRAELEEHAAALGIVEATAKPAPAPVKGTDPLATLRPILSPDMLKGADQAIAAVVADLDTARRDLEAARREVEHAASVPVKPGAHRTRKVETKTVADLIGSRAQIAQAFSLDVCDCPDAPAVDPDFVFDAALFSEVAAAITEGLNVAFYGDRGTGKSSFVRQIAAITRRPHFEISFHGESSGSELFGTWGLDGDGGMVWVNGDLLEAMTTPYAVIDLSEISASRPDLVMQLNAVLEEGSRSIYVGGTRHRVHPTVTFFATSNDNGSGENAHRFAGVRAMNDATRSRFVWLELNLPTRGQLADMLAAAAGIPKDAAEMVADFELKMRDHVKQAKAETTPGLRAWKAFGRLVRAGISARRAFAMAVENVSSTDDGAVWRQDLNNFDCERFEKLARGEAVPAPDASPVDPASGPATRHGFTATA